MPAAPLSFAQQQLNVLNEQNFTSLVDAFNQACETFADRPAFTCIEQVLSFTDIEAHSRHFGAFFDRVMRACEGRPYCRSVTQFKPVSNRCLGRIESGFDRCEY